MADSIHGREVHVEDGGKRASDRRWTETCFKVLTDGNYDVAFGDSWAIADLDQRLNHLNGGVGSQPP